MFEGCYFFQVKGLDVDSLFISHIQVNQAQKQRRRTYRAHGRINRMLLLISNYCTKIYLTFYWICNYICSIYVLSVSHWINFVWERRASEEGGNLWANRCFFEDDSVWFEQEKGLKIYTYLLIIVLFLLFFAAWITVGDQQQIQEGLRWCGVLGYNIRHLEESINVASFDFFV